MKGPKTEPVQDGANSFSEVQAFSRWWILFILIAIFSISALINPDDPSAKLVHYIAFIFGAIVAGALAITRLITEYNPERISIRFFPFMHKEIYWSEVEACRLINYGFVGGWGLRLYTKYGTVYNIRGNKGVYLKLKSGKQMLIGTQKTSEIDATLKQICPDIYGNDL